MLCKALLQKNVSEHTLKNGGNYFCRARQYASMKATNAELGTRYMHSAAHRITCASNNKIKHDVRSAGNAVTASRPTLQASSRSSSNKLSRGGSRRQFSQTAATQHPGAPSGTPAELSADEYHRLADAYIERLVEELEALAEERQDVDVEYSSGVLTLALPPAGTYVINKQPPNRQIWLSSPVSGPKRYDWVVVAAKGEAKAEAEAEAETKGAWIYLRDGSALNDLLAEEVGIDVVVLEEAVKS